MAPNYSNKYEKLILTDEAHHYLYYVDEKDKRVDLIKKMGELLKLDFKISDFWYIDEDYTETIKDSRIDKLYLCILINRNLNNYIDKGELTKVTIKFK